MRYATVGAPSRRNSWERREAAMVAEILLCGAFSRCSHLPHRYIPNRPPPACRAPHPTCASSPKVVPTRKYSAAELSRKEMKVPRMPKLRQAVRAAWRATGGARCAGKTVTDKVLSLCPMCLASRPEATRAHWRNWDAVRASSPDTCAVHATVLCWIPFHWSKACCHTHTTCTLPSWWHVPLPEDCGQVAEEEAALHRQPRVEDDGRKQVAVQRGRAGHSGAQRGRVG